MAEPSLSDLLKTLSPTQLDFVQARMFCKSDKEAAEACKLSTSTVYQWSNLDDVRLAVSLAKQDGIILGQEMLRRLIPDAIDALADEIKARRGSNKRLDAIVEILNRTIGKPTDKQEVSSPGGGALEIVVRHVEIPLPDFTREDASPTAGS